MRLFATLAIGFGIAFGVGLLAKFTYQTNWIAGLIISGTIYISLQVDELYMLVVMSVPNAVNNAKLPNWMKERLRKG